jgi:uncharacterized protein (TIGR02246 family)
MLTAVVMAACAPAEPEPMATTGTAEDEAAIRASVTSYAAAYGSKDAAALVAHATEDYEAVGPDGTMLSGRAGLQEVVAAEMAMVPADVSIAVSATVGFLRWISADAAVVGGTWTAAGMPAGMGPDRGSYLSVYRRDTDGQWRMSHGMSAPYMPPEAPPTTP